MTDDLPLIARLRALVQEAPPPLPVLPAVADRAASLLAAGAPAATELLAVAGSDPVLAGNLLRAAGAAYYAGLPRLRSLEDALSRIGSEAAARIIADACRSGRDGTRGPLQSRYLQPLWQHSLGCALGARWLAGRCGYPELAAEAHLAGLLHDLGKWQLLACLAAPTADRPSPAIGDRLATEILASMHVEVGLQLLAAWQLPDTVGGAIGRHHQGDIAGEEVVVVLVRLANLGCRKLGLGWQRAPELVLPATAEAQFLGLDEIALAELEIMLEDHFGLVDTSPPDRGVAGRP